MSSDESDEWSAGERILEEVGLRRDRTSLTTGRGELPVAPSNLNTAALQTLGGNVVICPLDAVVLHEDGDADVVGREWIFSNATLSLEEWR